ncbi:MAG: tRNA (guanosine(37)-N1)-methyltransferase TrmD [Butyrivibrio sp.]|nr:tRNA (guanosine(37)-N1)-methyltransferase TrmD [Butyrivibrio sp.]
MTLFPEVIEAGLGTSILGRAFDRGIIRLTTWQIREYTTNRQGMVDDYTYGGGAGMLMQAQPIYDCYRAVCTALEQEGKAIQRPRTIYMTPQGRPFTQELAHELAQEPALVVLCGHYEGVDERVIEEIVTDEISIGDYVLTGGELPAMVLVDAVARLIPGVLHNGDSADIESFHGDLLEYPQYSRPEVWNGRRVPEILLSGDHARVEAWRRAQSEERTRRRRPDLYARYEAAQIEADKQTKKGMRRWTGEGI